MQRKQALQISIVTIAVISLSLLYFFYPAKDFSFYPDCFFNKLTGLFCPGCGSQRAVSALLHGDVLKAADFNILMLLSVPLLMYSAFVFIWNSFKDRKLQQRVFYSPLFAKSFLTFVILFGILRNLPYYPFNWLAP